MHSGQFAKDVHFEDILKFVTVHIPPKATGKKLGGKNSDMQGLCISKTV